MDKENENNKQIQNKPIIKISLGLAIGICITVIIIVGIMLYILNNTKSQPSGNNNSSNSNINIGVNPKLIVSSSGIFINTWVDDFVDVKSENEKEYILDLNKNKIINEDEDFTKDIGYLGDSFFYNKKEKSIQKRDKTVKNIIENLDISNFSASYSNGILYYSEGFLEKSRKTVAYDLNQNKELWRIDDCISPKVYGNRFLYVSYLAGGDPEGKSIFNIKNGELIAKSSSTQIYFPTEQDYYYEVNLKRASSESINSINVYDYNKNLIKSFPSTIFEDNSYSAYFEAVLPSGLIIIKRNNNNSYGYKYEIYNKDGVLIIVLDDTDGWLDYDRSKRDHSILQDRSKYTLILSNEQHFTFDYVTTSEERYGLGSKDKLYYILGIERGKGTTLISMSNGKKLALDTKHIDGYKIQESPNGGYAIINYIDEKLYNVYNSNLESIYETTNKLSVLSDEYVIEYSNTNDEIYLVNVKTNKKEKLNVKGKYSSNNTKYLITKEDDIWHLYSFE